MLQHLARRCNSMDLSRGSACTLRIYGALLSYTMYIAADSTDNYTQKGNEYYLEADFKRLRNGQSMQNIRPTPNGTSRSAAMPKAPKQLHILNRSAERVIHHPIMQSIPNRRQKALVGAR